MSTSYDGSLFLLGATGYVGAELLLQLKEQYPNIHVTALVRRLSPQVKARLTQLNPNVTFIDGSLENTKLIQELTSKAAITVNSATGYDGPHLRAILAGLEDASKQRPRNPPIYIHLSTIGTLSDNAQGQLVSQDKIPKYVDSTFNIDGVPSTNVQVSANKAVATAGDREDVPIKTMVLFPPWVYGIGPGPRKITLAFRSFFDVVKASGRAVTFGPGHNRIPGIHIKDFANCIIAMIRGALDGTAGTGSQGFYFANQDFETAPTAKEIMDVVGNTFYDLGIAKAPGSCPISEELQQTVTEAVVSIFGGNAWGIPDQLKKLGVEFTETNKVTLLQSLPEEIAIAARDWA